jgi:prophage antirepressor-like protein
MNSQIEKMNTQIEKMKERSEGLDRETRKQIRLVNKYLRYERVCTVCGKMKPLKQFYSGHQCKTCLGQKPTPAEAVNNVFDLMFNNKCILTLVDKQKCVWYKAIDVCDALEYSHHTNKKAITRYVKSDDKYLFKDLDLLGTLSTPKKINYRTTFVNESGVNSLVLSSKKPVAKQFRQWLTSEVIPSIKRTGRYEFPEHKAQYFLQDDGMPYFSRRTVLSDPNVDVTHISPDYTSHELVNELLTRKVNLMEFHNKHVMYYFVTSIHNLLDKRIIIKFGYTHNILERIRSLRTEYGSDFTLVDIMEVNSSTDEKDFHKLIEASHPELKYMIKLDKKQKIELYFFDPRLTKMFDTYDCPLRHKKQTSGDIEYLRLQVELIKEQRRLLMVQHLFKERESVCLDL